MPKLIKLSIICLLIFNVFSVFALTVSAGDSTPAPAQSTGLLPKESNRPSNSASCPAGSNCGGYTLNDMVGVVLKISEFILGIVGSLALLAFVYGGVMWMISAGDAEKVMTGKRAITGAVIGLAIVFTSFMIIQLVYSALGIESQNPQTGQNKIGTWSVSNWFK